MTMLLFVLSLAALAVIIIPFGNAVVPFRASESFPLQFRFQGARTNDAARQLSVVHEQFPSAVELNEQYCEPGYLDPNNYIKPENAKLLSVHIFARHGDRTAIRLLANESGTKYQCPHDVATVVQRKHSSLLKTDVKVLSSPYGNYFKGGCMTGQLTTHGFEQHKMIGNRTFAVYKDALNLTVFAEDGQVYGDLSKIYIRSTNVWRTKQSSVGFMMGFEGRNSFEKKPPSVHILPQEHEVLGPNTRACPRLVELMNEFLSTESWQDYLSELVPVKPKLDKILGTGNNPVYSGSIDRYHDVLQVRHCHNQPMPCNTEGECIDSELMQTVAKLGKKEYQLLAETQPQSDEIAKLSVGNVVGEVIERLLDPPKEKKLFFYANHDTTMGPLLVTLKPDTSKFNHGWPPYAANLYIEHWRKSGAEFIRVFYNGEQLHLAECEDECPLDKFVTLWSRFRVGDMKSACVASKEMKTFDAFKGNSKWSTENLEDLWG